MQPNSILIGIINPDGRGALAQIETENPPGKKSITNLDILEINKKILTLQNQVKNNPPEKQFLIQELSLFHKTLEKLRLAKRISTKFPPPGEKF